MCLNVLCSEDERKEWLRKKKSTFIAYKVVRVKNNRYYPIFYTNQKSRPFLKTKENIVPSGVYGVWTNSKGYNMPSVRYYPYFHLFSTLKSAGDWIVWEDLRHREATYGEIRVLKCEVQKKYVTALGDQYAENVIVAKRFKILGAVKCV